MTASETSGRGGTILAVIGRLTPPNRTPSLPASPDQTPPDLTPLDRTDGVPARVTDAQVLDLLSAARVAPSADNLQTWRFVVVRSAEGRTRLATAISGLPPEALEQASVVIVVCGIRTVVRRARREQPFALIDVPIALSHLLLRAAEANLPHAWTLDVDEAACRRELGIPGSARVVAAVALG